MTHILGYVGRINDRDVERLKKEEKFANYSGSTDMGKLGIERYYEEQLHGTTGFEEVEINNRGKVIRKLREQPATAGKSIHLTIDFTLQRYIMSLLSGQKGAVVVLDPKDNSVLAMVSTPSTIIIYSSMAFLPVITNVYSKIQLDHFTVVQHKGSIHRPLP